MRFLLSLLFALPIVAYGQLCSAPSPISYSGFGAQQTQADFFDNADYLDGLNNSSYWSLGSGISDNNLCIKENAYVSTFLGVKLRNAVAPNDNVVSAGNKYFVEPGFSPATQNGGTGNGPEAKWNILMYAGLTDGAFDSVDVVLHIDFDPCFGYTESEMYSINIGEAFDSNPFTQAENFSSFGINTNLGSTEIANLNPDGTGFDATVEGYYTFAIEVLNNCGTRKMWNEITVYVQAQTTDSGAAAADSNGNGVYDDNEVTGCQNHSACNYNCNATVSSSCDFVSCSGCTVAEACNYNPAATTANSSACDYPVDLYGEDYFDCEGNCLNDADEDGVCDEDEIAGCQDASACNYNANATNAGTCNYPATHYNCGGTCINDADGDGVCDEAEIGGCTAPAACNYSASATDNDGTCDYTSCAGCAVVQACNYDATATISQSICVFATGCDSCSGATDGTGTVVDGDTDNDGVCNANEINGCTDENAINYSPFATEDDGSCQLVLPGSGCNYCGSFDPDTGACTDPITYCNYGPYLNSDNSTCANPCTGDMAGSPAPMGLVTTCDLPWACNYGQEGTCEYTSCVGCMNDEACNYNPSATQSAACTFDCYGCTDSDADNYDGTATLDDGSCVFSGCTSAVACNYDSAATEDDGSCEFTSCTGCMDATACTYDPTATLNLPLDCVYPDAGYTCSGDCVTDTDGDGTCDEFEVNGCTDSNACNFNASATEEDGSCTYPASSSVDCAGNCLVDEDEDGVCDDLEVYGCTVLTACNYTPGSTENDGSCEFLTCAGCTISTACNYDPTATLSNNITCTYIPVGWDDCDQTICTDSDSDGICDFDEPAGCVGEFNEPHLSLIGAVETPVAVADWGATDFAGASSDDTGVASTTFVDFAGRLADGRYSVTRIYTIEDVCANTAQAAQLLIADDSHPEGCTNPNATSYDAGAINDDGTCDYSPACLGDLNLDNIVGTSDLLILLSSFGLPCPQ